MVGVGVTDRHKETNTATYFVGVELCRPCPVEALSLRAQTRGPATKSPSFAAGQVLQVPIAHGEGKYVCDSATLAELTSSGRVLFRYCASDGALTDDTNPNGSLDNIAGVASADFRILGMMPHPERASDPALGSGDGRALFESLLRFWR